MRSDTRRSFIKATVGSGVLTSGLGMLESSDSSHSSKPVEAPHDGSEVSVHPEAELGSISLEREHCLAAPAFFAAHDIEPGQQIRVRRSDEKYAVFTVFETSLHLEESKSTVWIGTSGSARLGEEPPFEATINSVVPRQTYDQDEARSEDEFVELLDDSGGSRLAVIAPHGGWIEPYTDQQAVRVADRLDRVTMWGGLGFRQGGGSFDRWHITSTDIHPQSYPILGSIADRGFEYAVSFHGFDGDGILIGGTAPPELKESIRSAIAGVHPDSTRVRIADKGEYSGGSPDNVVNWLTSREGHGIQIEQGFAVRDTRAIATADAVADVCEREMLE